MELIQTIERLYSADIRAFGQPHYEAMQHGRVIVADSLGLLLEELGQPSASNERRRPRHVAAGRPLGFLTEWAA